MKRLLLLVLVNGFAFSGLAQTNTFPPSGNAGIGTVNPAGELDVYNGYYTHGYKFMDNKMSNPSVGFFNPIAMAVRQGRKLYLDEEFAAGLNHIVVYDNYNTGLVTITRSNTIQDLPNSSGYSLIITHAGSGEAPGYGGVRQVMYSGINKTSVQLFRAKLPVGYAFNLASNDVGTGGSNYWLSNNAGTGKWEWYIHVLQSGTGGTFSTSGHIYVTGSPAPSSAAPLVWYIASCTAFDLTNVNDADGNDILNQNTADQNASFRINGNGVVGGNVLIGKTSQVNTSYKLDVNGNVRANKVVVNTTGADYVFDSAYQMLSIDSLDAYVGMHHHLPGIPAADSMQKNGMEIGEMQTQLLQKVEELSLYVIQLQKALKDQRRETESLKEQLSMSEVQDERKTR